jgi:hypothetical protein
MTGLSLKATEYCSRPLLSNESRNCTPPSGLARTTLSAAESWAARQSTTTKMQAIRMSIYDLQEDTNLPARDVLSEGSISGPRPVAGAEEAGKG